MSAAVLCVYNYDIARRKRSHVGMYYYYYYGVDFIFHVLTNTFHPGSETLTNIKTVSE